jgi:prepilin signal peptidase PulO-like enzyme (type II secretory pathway)
MNTIFRATILFILWTIFGSFWGVVIGREWTKEWMKSIFFGRSKCDKCDKTLSAIELIPIISFCIQKWKCKKCHTKLPHLYWIIELVMWICFLLTYLFFPYSSIWELIFWLAINRSFVLILIFDIQKYELHQPIWIFMTTITIIYSLIKFPVMDIAWSALPTIIIFLAIYFFGKRYVKIRFGQTWEGFGLWDVFLAITIWFLSIWIFTYQWIEINIINSLNFTFLYIILSCIIGLVYVCIERLVSNRKDTKIPFLPAMIVSFRVLLFTCNLFINLFR